MSNHSTTTVPTIAEIAESLEGIIGSARVAEFGSRPVRTATGLERWVKVAENEDQIVVTACKGWLISTEIRLSACSSIGLVAGVVHAVIVDLGGVR